MPADATTSRFARCVCRRNPQQSENLQDARRDGSSRRKNHRSRLQISRQRRRLGEDMRSGSPSGDGRLDLSSTTEGKTLETVNLTSGRGSPLAFATKLADPKRVIPERAIVRLFILVAHR